MFVNANGSPTNQKAGSLRIHTCRCGEHNLLKFMARIRVSKEKDWSELELGEGGRWCQNSSCFTESFVDFLFLPAYHTLLQVLWENHLLEDKHAVNSRCVDVWSSKMVDQNPRLLLNSCHLWLQTFQCVAAVVQWFHPAICASTHLKTFLNIWCWCHVFTKAHEPCEMYSRGSRRYKDSCSALVWLKIFLLYWSVQRRMSIRTN